MEPLFVPCIQCEQTTENGYIRKIFHRKRQPALRTETQDNLYNSYPVSRKLNTVNMFVFSAPPGEKSPTEMSRSWVERRKSGLGCTIIIGLLMMTGCATTPTGRSQLALMQESQMDQMGVQAFSNLKQSTPVDHSTEANQFVQCVALAITREVGSGWEVVVFEDGSANAFALPGKKIGVNTGLLEVAENQDQLATIIGHEVAHVLSHHANERVSQKLAVETGINALSAVASPQSAAGQQMMGLLGVGAKYGILMPYSRAQESEADILGLDLMAKAGFNPLESIQLWKNMRAEGGAQSPEFLSTHPSHRTRMDDLIEHMSVALELRNKAYKRGKRPSCR